MAHAAYAVCAPGLESLTVNELRQLDIEPSTVEPGGVAFRASDILLAHALVQLRTATRVLIRAAEFRTTGFPQLVKRARAIPWGTWVVEGGRFHLRVTCKKSKLYHSGAVADRIAEAIMAAVPGAGPASRDHDHEVEHSVQLFVVRIAHDVCTISADAAGSPLHQRGYRQAVAKAPLRESLAAAMLIGAEWNERSAVYDPLCGSGTIVIEAALRAARIAPGLARTFAAERWPSTNPRAWAEARSAAASAVRKEGLPPLVGSDRDAGAIEAARSNAERAGVGPHIEFLVAPLSAATPPTTSGLLITNPPYGVRVGDNATLRNLYARLGTIAREAFAGWSFAMLSADRTRGHVLERQMGMGLTTVWQSSNGGIPVRLLRRQDGTKTEKRNAPRQRSGRRA